MHPYNRCCSRLYKLKNNSNCKFPCNLQCILRYKLHDKQSCRLLHKNWYNLIHRSWNMSHHMSLNTQIHIPLCILCFDRYNCNLQSYNWKRKSSNSLLCNSPNIRLNMFQLYILQHKLPNILCDKLFHIQQHMLLHKYWCNSLHKY
jgi:hypothetical protein